MKNIYKLILSITVISFLTGCGVSNNEKLTIPMKELTGDKNKAYVVFMYQDSFGARCMNEILEYHPNTNQIELVGKLCPGEKIVYPISEGEHIFYNRFWAGIVTKVNAKRGQTYYTNTFFTLPNLDDNIFEKLAQDITGLECSEKNLDKYMFDNNGGNNFESPLLLKMECQDNKIQNVQRFRSSLLTPLEQLNKETQLVKSKEDVINSFEKNRVKLTEETKNIYELWKNKLEDLFLQDWDTYLKLRKPIPDEYFQKFNNINLIEGHHIVSNSANITSFRTKLENSFNEITSKDNSSLITVKYSILKYDDGSQIKRYVGGGFNPLSTLSGMATVHIKLDFFNENKELINTIYVADMLTGGIFGGFNKLDSNVINLANEYVKRNLLVKTKEK